MKTRFEPDLGYSRDTGLIIVFVLLLVSLWNDSLTLVLPAIAVLLAAMTIPVLFKPAALIWYYFSFLLGSVTNRILLTLLFVVVLSPVGIIRKWFVYDPMRRKAWKKGTHSVFVVRDHVFSSKDLTEPF
jgi:hypothetical protein